MLGQPAPQGPPGAKGPTGIKGNKGPTGKQGIPGSGEGVKGNIGDQGPTGPSYQGSQGPKGPRGYMGFPGGQGPKGPRGFQGDPSDVRAKKNIEILTESLDKVKMIRGIEFLWSSDYKPNTLETPTDIGVIAQEIQQVLPELVSEGPDGFLRVNYPQITSLLVNAFNEQHAKLKVVQNEIDSML
jgi:hypothetical protein